MADQQSYAGSCHCGAVRYEVRSGLTPLVACNCSICSKHGLVLTFVPADAFTLLAGEASLRDYQFGPKRIHHMFCAGCGVETFGRGTGADGKEMIAINVRCLDGVDVATLSPKPYDGRSL
jgi:hypothetical protein